MAKGLMSSGFRMEAIDFQLKDSFGPDLEAIITRIEKKCKKGFTGLEVQKLSEIKMLEKVIFDRLKMRVSINTTQNAAAVIPFHLSKNAVLLNKFFRQEDFLKEQAEHRESGYAKGSVDEKNAKLGGVFSDYVHTMYLEFDLLFNMDMTVTEITSVILHELGHAFYACSYSSRMDRCNQVLSDALRKGDGTDKDKFIEVTYQELKGTYPEIRKEAVEKLTSRNPTIVCTGAYQILAEAVYQQQENSKYDDSSFEALADHFSARFGYGEALVTGLEKLYPGGVQSSYYQDAFNAAAMTMHLVLSFFATLFQLNVWLFLSGSIVGNIIATMVSYFRLYEAIINFIWLSLLTYYLIKTSGESGRNYTYDDLVKRYNRIRNQVIESVKDRSLSKKDATAAIETAEMIGTLIQNVKPYRGPLDFIFNAFNPKDIRAKNSIQRQQAIENLMSNDIFLMSMKLKVNS